MASERVQGAAQGASIGGKVGGPIGAGVGAVLGAFFGGGKGGGPASWTGYDVSGVATASGFTGDYFGTSRNSKQQFRWNQMPDIYGPGSAPRVHESFNASVKKFFSGLADRGYSSDFLASVKIPVSFSGGALVGEGLPEFTAQFERALTGAAEKTLPAAPPASTAPKLLESLQSAFTGDGPIQAPTVTYSQAGDPQAPQKGSGLVLASSAPATGSGLSWLALLFGAFYVVKHV